eukprot:TRINITY_DN38558_c0_g1_i1.p1 TRINITY_DN38558_c0_g1~~TRINITY_DN38558_c0_g1_i1.p1  ORF type:complete len:693 (-),score=94.59 TRINITY_DN38558_c0_g1_i1:342-2420(-)
MSCSEISRLLLCRSALITTKASYRRPCIRARLLQCPSHPHMRSRGFSNARHLSSTSQVDKQASASDPDTKLGEDKKEELRIDKQVSDSRASLAQLWQILRPERGRMLLGFGALCASSTVNLSYPYLVGRLVDLFGEGGEGLSFVMDHTLTCGTIVVAGGIATFCRLFLIETAIERIAFRLRREFFGTLLQRPISFFDAHKTGELVNRLSNDITLTSRVLIDASAGIRSSITACVGTFMVFQLAPTEMIISLLSPVSAVFIVGMAYGRLRRRIAEKQQQRLAEAVQLAEERMSSIRTVRTFNAEGRELRQFENMLDLVYAAGRQNALATAGMSCFFVTGGGLFLLHIVYNCGLMVASGAISVGTTVSLAMYCGMAGASYTGVVTAYGDIQKCLGACQKVLDILKDDTYISAANAMTTKSLLTNSKVIEADAKLMSPLAVKFEDVHFAYPTRSDMPVLNGLNMDIPAGSRVALLGSSGSGKSTVAHILAGLYNPIAGQVLVDGRNVFLDPDGPAWVRSQLGVISQEPTLFALSIKDNIDYGLDSDEQLEASDTAFQDATAAAYVDDFAATLPQGFATPAGERGHALSGGQKQRVCIARALIRKPRMLIFDEATSALDLRSERRVQRALGNALSAGDCTCLVITHRLSTLEWVDRIAVIHEGRIVQYGLKEEVLSKPCSPLQSILRSGSSSIEEA